MEEDRKSKYMKKKIIIQPTLYAYMRVFVMGVISIILSFVVFIKILPEYDIAISALVLLYIIFCYYYTYYLIGRITYIHMGQEGCSVKRGFKTSFHNWNDFKIIRHEKYKTGKDIRKEAIFFSTVDSSKKETIRPDYYLVFRNKMNNFYVDIVKPKDIRNADYELDSLWYPKEEFLRTLGEWGVKVESLHEDMSVYLKEKEEQPIVLKDGIYIRKERTNDWLVVTNFLQHNIIYYPDTKTLYIDGIKKEIRQESYVKMMGIEEQIKIDGKKLLLVIRNKKCRIVYKGKFVDTDETYIPLRAERLIYICVPFPVIIAICAAFTSTHSLFVISFAIVLGLALYLKHEIKKVK